MSDKKEESTPENSETNQIDAALGDNTKNAAIGWNINQDNRKYTIHNYGPSNLNTPLSKDDLSDEEKELLKAGYMDVIRILPQLFNPIALISAGGKGIPQAGRYKRALKRLRELGLIRRIGDKNENYELTGIGDTIAETLL